MAIQSFRCKHTKQLYEGTFVKKFSGFERQALKHLRILDCSNSLEELNALPSNCFEGLIGDRKGQLSIRVNNQWRVCFYWDDDGPFDVEIVDYH